MAKVLTDSNNYVAIADALRAKGLEGSWKPAEMPEAIATIHTGGEISRVETTWGGTPAYYDFTLQATKTGKFYINMLEDAPEDAVLYIGVTGYSSSYIEFSVYDSEGNIKNELENKKVGPYVNSSAATVSDLQKGDRVFIYCIEPYGYTISCVVTFVYKPDGQTYGYKDYDKLTWKPTVDQESGTAPKVTFNMLQDAALYLESQGYLQVDDVKYMDAEGAQF